MTVDEAVIAVFLILPLCMPTGDAHGRAGKEDGFSIPKRTNITCSKHAGDWISKIKIADWLTIAIFLVYKHCRHISFDIKIRQLWKGKGRKGTLFKCLIF